MKSDGLLLDVSQLRQALKEMSQLRHDVLGKTAVRVADTFCQAKINQAQFGTA